MITKYLWEQLMFEIKWIKNHGGNSEEKLEYFFILISLIVFTLPLLFVDLLLLPFEILYYLFCKWLESDKKEKRKTNNKYKILKLFMNRRNNNAR